MDRRERLPGVAGADLESGCRVVAQARIGGKIPLSEHDPQGLEARASTTGCLIPGGGDGAHGELRVVGECRPGAGEHGSAGGAQGVHVGARLG